MANRLQHEKSPYLLQHADNPVDWYPWGQEAFDKAKRENKPVFLSVGYATCHWCHVMAHESFEDEEVAEVINRYFVPVKVDREERPDVDSVYMTVCQAVHGSGGWPLTVFLTPEGKPFFAGTYFPKTGRMGMSGFKDLLQQLHKAWVEQGERVAQVSEEIVRAIQAKPGEGGQLDMNVLRNGFEQLRSAFDPEWGGFGRAPKFPTPHHLTFALRWHRRYPNSEALAIVEKTLDAMRDGGIFDHLGLGFHRYSVDERWFAPHFEKMLYDQAMLAMAYLEAYQVTGKERYATVAREIFEYVLRDMQDPDGGFYSAEDADSEGVEGLFYLWTPSEVKEVAGEETGDLFCRFYDIREGGNFEHSRSIPHISKPLETFAQSEGMDPEDLERTLSDARKKLYEAREKRIHPLKDDKILTAWNGLMIAALAKGYQVLREPRYLDAARRSAEFVLNTLATESGRLMRRYRDGEVAHPGYLDDYAFFGWGLLELYESTFDVSYLEHAASLQQKTVELFHDDEQGGFFFTPADGEKLIVRDKELHDGATPSSNSVTALNLLRLARMTGTVEWDEMAERLFRSFASSVSRFPMAYTQFLNAIDFSQGPVHEIVIAGDPGRDSTQAMVEALHTSFQPNRVVLLLDDGDPDKLAELAPFVQAMKSDAGGEAVAYVCRAHACQRPVDSLNEFKQAAGIE